MPGEADRVDVAIGIAPNLSVKVESHDTRAVRSKCFKPLLPGGVRRDNELLDTSFGRVDAFNRRRNLAKFAQRAKNVKLALNSKITHLNSRSQSALASNILVQHIEQPMHRYLFLRLMD